MLAGLHDQAAGIVLAHAGQLGELIHREVGEIVAGVDATLGQLGGEGGVEAFQTSTVEHTDEMVRQVDEELLRIGRVKEGDLVVIVAGSPPGIPGSTNALRIHRMGDAINEVAPAYRRKS